MLFVNLCIKSFLNKQQVIICCVIYLFRLACDCFDYQCAKVDQSIMS